MIINQLHFLKHPQKNTEQFRVVLCEKLFSVFSEVVNHRILPAQNGPNNEKKSTQINKDGIWHERRRPHKNAETQLKCNYYLAPIIPRQV